MAANMSERDLLLLSNFAYFAPDQIAEGTPLGVMVEAKLGEMRKIAAKDPDATVGGDISARDAVIMLEDMQYSPNLTQLVVAKQDNSINAICYEVPGTRDAVVAFQGTGGTYERWKDNAVGLTVVDTEYRQGIERFARECSEYSSITTTGHSKGGHGAEHFAVVSSSNTERVVSFDGYGGSKEYAQKYAKELALVKDRITAINGDNDYIQGIDTDFAGKVSYVKNTGTDFKSFHRSSDLYFSGEYDSNGNFSSSCLQATPSAFGIAAKLLINKMIDELRGGIFKGVGTRATEIVGVILGVFLGGGAKQGWADIVKMLTKDLLSFGVSLLAIGKIIKVVASNWKEIIAVVALLKLESATGEKAKRRHKVKPPQYSGSGFLAKAMQLLKLFMGSGPDKPVTKYNPEVLRDISASIDRMARDMKNLTEQMRYTKRMLSEQLMRYRTSAAVSCRVEAPNVCQVYPGELQDVISRYSRMLDSYSEEISILAKRIREAQEILDRAERDLLSRAQELQTE